MDWQSLARGVHLGGRFDWNDTPKKNDAMKNLKHLWMTATLGLGLLALPAIAQNDPANPPPRPDKPEKPERPSLPPEIQDLIQKFRDEQKAALEQWRNREREMREATKEQREQLRDQLRQLLDEQKGKREQLREQIRERLEQLAKDLPNRKEIIEAAKEQLRAMKKHGRGE